MVIFFKRLLLQSYISYLLHSHTFLFFLPPLLFLPSFYFLSHVLSLFPSFASVKLRYLLSRPSLPTSLIFTFLSSPSVYFHSRSSFAPPPRPSFLSPSCLLPLCLSLQFSFCIFHPFPPSFSHIFITFVSPSSFYYFCQEVVSLVRFVYLPVTVCFCLFV